MPRISRRRFSTGLFAASVIATVPAFALAYPARSIKLIAPYPPGGGVDTVAHLIAERLAARLNQTITVENVQEWIALAKSKPGS